MSKKERFGLIEFIQRFSSEACCREYLVAKRWPDGFICPKCGEKQGYILAKGHIQCAAYRHQASVTAGTVMHGSYLPLTKWFLAMYPGDAG